MQKEEALVDDCDARERALALRHLLERMARAEEGAAGWNFS